MKKTEEMTAAAMERVYGDDGKDDCLNGRKPDYGQYICSEEGISVFDEKEGIAVPICSHPVFPTRRYVNVETGEESFDISSFRDGEWRTLPMVSCGIIFDAERIIQLADYDISINSINAKEMVRYLSSVYEKNRAIIPKTETAGRMGWTEDMRFIPYIPGILYDGDMDFTELFESVHKEGSYEDWKRFLLAVRGYRVNRAAQVITAASVGSAFLKWTCGHPFILHLWSPENSTGKSAALMLAASIWGDPMMGRFIQPLDSTDEDTDRMNRICNHLPLCLDDVELVLAEDIRRGFFCRIFGIPAGEGNGKDPKIRRLRNWHNITIVSGENDLVREGRGNRNNPVISLDARGYLMPWGPVGQRVATDTLIHHFGHAGEIIIQGITAIPDWQNVIRERYREYRKSLKELIGDPQADCFAAIMVGDWLMEKFIAKDGNRLTPEDVIGCLAEPGLWI